MDRRAISWKRETAGLGAGRLGRGGDQEFHFGEGEQGRLLASQVRVLGDGLMHRSGAPGSLLTGPQC